MIIKVHGELDHHYAAKIRQLIDQRIIELGIKNLIVDVSEITFMDSSGIGVILGRYNIVDSKGGSIYLTGINNKIDKIISMSGLLSLVHIAKTLPDALHIIEGIDVDISKDISELYHEVYI